MSDISDPLPGALDRIAQLIQAEGAPGVVSVLDGSSGRWAPTPGVDGLGVMLLGDDLVLRGAAASDQRARLLALVQQDSGSGPSVDAFVEDRQVAVTDLVTEATWPDASQLVVAGVRAVLAVPVRLAAGPVGVLHTYLGDPSEWRPARVSRIQAWTDTVAEVLCLAARTRTSGRPRRSCAMRWTAPR